MPAFQYLCFYFCSPADPWTSLLLLAIIHSACGYWIAFTTLIATHHHPSNYHAGTYCYIILTSATISSPSF